MLDVHNNSAPSNITKLLRELQTSIHVILAHQRHNSLALSTLGLKYRKKSLFTCWCQSLE